MANSRHANGTESGYLLETEQERSDRAHEESERRRLLRERLISGGFLKQTNTPTSIQNHRAMWR